MHNQEHNMKTYDTIYQIEHRADPRRQMIYISPPFTAMTEDVNLMGAEMVVASQESLLDQNVHADGVLRMHERNEGRRHNPELDTGSVASYLI